MDERRFKAAASSRTILNIQFELKTLMIRIKQNKKYFVKKKDIRDISDLVKLVYDP